MPTENNNNSVPSSEPPSEDPFQQRLAEVFADTPTAEPVVEPEPEPQPYGYCYDCEAELDDEGDSYSSEYDMNERCESCNGEHYERMMDYEDQQNGGHPSVHYYSYRPSLLFWSVRDGEAHSSHRGNRPGVDRGMHQPLYMGFELEVEVVDGSLWDSVDAVVSRVNRDVALDDFEQLLYFKEDGSLSHGFEIVTQPATLEFYEKCFPWNAIEELRGGGCSAWNRQSCGLHIHMNRRSFMTDLHLWKFLVFVYKNPTELTRFAGRNSSYAKFGIEAFLNDGSYYNDERGRSASKFITHAKGYTRNYDRYTAVNLQNVETIELRFFRPSLNTKTVRAALQMCAAIQDYTEALTTKQVLDGALQFTEFRDWVRAEPQYALLSDRIATRLGEVEPQDS